MRIFGLFTGGLFQGIKLKWCGLESYRSCDTSECDQLADAALNGSDLIEDPGYNIQTQKKR